MGRMLTVNRMVTYDESQEVDGIALVHYPPKREQLLDDAKTIHYFLSKCVPPFVYNSVLRLMYISKFGKAKAVAAGLYNKEEGG